MKKGIFLLTYVGFRTKIGARIVFEILGGKLFYARDACEKYLMRVVVENILVLYARKCARKVTVFWCGVFFFFFFKFKKNVRYVGILTVGYFVTVV